MAPSPMDVPWVADAGDGITFQVLSSLDHTEMQAPLGGPRGAAGLAAGVRQRLIDP